MAIVSRKCYHLHMSHRFTPSNYFLIIILITVLALITNHLWHQDVLFHTDLARDFLVMEDMVVNKKATLIGPRSGGIPGVFHGPAWYYINLLPFILAEGNPVIMGWFWWLLGVTAISVFCLISYKISKNLNTSLLVSICFALLLLPKAACPINNYLADLFSFLVFYIWWKWWQKPSLRLAILAWFALSMLIQFQMAFAVPVMMILGPVFLYKVWQTKQHRQLLSLLVLAIPLSTFLLFELRHDFLQLHSVFAYLGKTSQSDQTIYQVIWQRIVSAAGDGLNIFKILPALLSLPIMFIFGYLGWQSKVKSTRLAISLVLVAYFGWWALTMFFSGSVWGYYFSPFFGIFLLVISLISASNQRARLILAIMTVFLLSRSRGDLFYNEERFNSSSWKLLSTIARDSLSQPDLGYFVYAQDQFAYSLKYAFYFQNKHSQGNKAEAFVKKTNTILVKSSDDPNNPYSTAKDWQINKIKIKQEPTSVKYYRDGYQVETYLLDEKTIKEPIDPNLIVDLHFR